MHYVLKNILLRRRLSYIVSQSGGFIIFTAGIGENSPKIRDLSCRGLNALGIVIDQNMNYRQGNGIREINCSDSKVKVMVIPTNEELKIAQETKKVIEDK
jgi:acetate kinase